MDGLPLTIKFVPEGVHVCWPADGQGSRVQRGWTFREDSERSRGGAQGFSGDRGKSPRAGDLQKHVVNLFTTAYLPLGRHPHPQG